VGLRLVRTNNLKNPLMKKIQLLLVAFCCPFIVFCQDISGLWTGTLHNDSTGLDYQYEIGITKEKGRYAGFSHTWFSIDGKQYFGVKKLKIRIANDGKIVILDDELLASNYPVQPNKDVRQLNVLSFQSSGNDALLDGPFETNRTKEYKALTGHVRVTKRKDILKSDLVPHLQQISKNIDWSFLSAGNEPLAKNEKE
jgi:hypothetical protein